ncbi:hypothetical protein M3Y99_01590700 [Aphelenchoides fujianensis]|nr:hypothetical protein M3Y99_01590700 [Aphelenchoides fujianensis]
MFSGGKSGGFGGFGGLGKFASGALKSAKEAGGQLQVKAQQVAQIAQQAASTGDLTQIGSQLTAPARPARSQSTTNVNAEMPSAPSAAASSSSLTQPVDPTAVMPGMEHLSEEERMKIMAVMACAEIDAAPTRASLSRSGEAECSAAQERKTNCPSAAFDLRLRAAHSGRDRRSGGVGAGRGGAARSYSMEQPQADVFQQPPLVEELDRLPGEDVYLVESESYEKQLNAPFVAEMMPTFEFQAESQQPPPPDYPQFEEAAGKDDDVWMQQPRQEFQVPETWEETHHQRAGRMWTTVFSDDGDLAASEYDEITPHVSYEQRDKSPPVWQVQSDDLPEAREEQADLIYDSRDQQERMEMYGRLADADGSFEVQMEDPLSPTNTMVVSSALAGEAVDRAERELKGRRHRGESATGHRPKGTPEITITHHEPQKEEDEDSDAETSPSDEDDYPDQIIEAPTAPMNTTQMEQREREAEHSADAQEVLRQIQSFGEAADDEFDVQWAASMSRKPKEAQESKADGQQQPNGHIERPTAVEEKESGQPAVQRQAQRINPFLDSPEDEAPDVTVEQVHLDSEDVENNQAIHYYYKNPDIYHRPGPVYTIPEGDEGTSPQPSRESRYNPQLLERRPLHGTTIPPLVPVDSKRKSTDSSATATTPAASSSTSTTADSRPLSQIPPAASATPASPAVPITPIRMAPPPPVSTDEEPTGHHPPPSPRSAAKQLVHQGAVTSAVPSSSPAVGAHRFTTDIPQPDDLLPVQSAHIHGAEAASDDRPPSCVAPSDAAFLAQTFGQRPPESSTLGAQLPSADHAVHELGDEDQTTPRLKRSPAMILSSDKPQSASSTADHFQYPPDTRAAPPATATTSAGMNASGRFVDEDALLLQSAAISEMGRRKLPSLPAGRSVGAAAPSQPTSTLSQQLHELQQQYPTTSTAASSAGTSTLLLYQQLQQQRVQQQQPPVYYSSHALEQKDVAVNGAQQLRGLHSTPAAPPPISAAGPSVSFSNVYFDQTNTAASRLVDHRLRSLDLEGRGLRGDLGGPSTSIYPPVGTSSVATSTHPVDPAVIPGAKFRSSSASQTASTSGPRLISTGGQRGGIPPSKISDTIAQLLFKQELRQALSRRRFAQETTEIEANHREFVIRRMLNSGLIPPELRREIDAQPDVVRCELPYELIAGARVVPPGRDLRRPRMYGTSYSASPSVRTSPQPFRQQQTSPSFLPRYTADRFDRDFTGGESTGVAERSWSSPTKRSVGCQSEAERADPTGGRNGLNVRIDEPFGTSARYSTQPTAYTASFGTSDRFDAELADFERAAGRDHFGRAEAEARRPYERAHQMPYSSRFATSDSTHSPAHLSPHRRPFVRPAGVDCATQTLVASETQTDVYLDSDQRPSASSHFSSLGRTAKKIPKPMTSDFAAGTSAYSTRNSGYGPTDDLLEATRSYFAEYDRRLRDGTDAYARSAARFTSHLPPPASTSPPSSTWNLPSGSAAEEAAEIEWKRRQVAAELERRKARVASLMDLRAANANNTWSSGAVGDDWQTPTRSTRPRDRAYDGAYGSLPRGYSDRDQWDSTATYPPANRRSQPYGSLPRDFERWMDVEGADGWLNQYPTASRFPSAGRRFGTRIDEYGVPRSARTTAPAEDTTLLSDYANYVNAQINAAGFLDDPDGVYAQSTRRQPLLYTTTVDEAGMLRPTAPYYDPADFGEDLAMRRANASMMRPQVPFVGSADDVYTLPPAARYPTASSTARSRYGQTFGTPMVSSMPSTLLQQPSPTADFVYSRREANYGARPQQPIGDYGNFELRRAMDYANRNPMSGEEWRQTGGTFPRTDPTAAYWAQQQQPLGYDVLGGIGGSFAPPPSFRTPRQPPPNGNWDARWPQSAPNTYTRPPPMYACSTQPRPQPQPYYHLSPSYVPTQQATQQSAGGYPSAHVLNTSSLGRNERRAGGILSTPRSHKQPVRNGHSMQNLVDSTAHRRSPRENGHVHSRARNGTKIKRILLTRRYRHANVYHDLGFRVTGGKRLPNGDLGAFITAVERIIDATSGEVEIVVKSGDSKSHKSRHTTAENIYDSTTDETRRTSSKNYDSSNFSPREKPPVPAHRQSISRSYVDQDDITRRSRLHSRLHAENENYGQLQLALGYDQLNGVLLVTIISARGLRCREYEQSIVLPNPFVKCYLLPGRRVVNKRRTKYVSNRADPAWHETVNYLVSYEELPSHYLEFTVWDYDKYNDNICLGQLTLYLDMSMLDNVPRFFDLQPAEKAAVAPPGVPASVPYTKPRTITNTNYFYNPANLDLGYPAI